MQSACVSKWQSSFEGFIASLESRSLHIKQSGLGVWINSIRIKSVNSCFCLVTAAFTFFEVTGLFFSLLLILSWKTHRHFTLGKDIFKGAWFVHKTSLEASPCADDFFFHKKIISNLILHLVGQLRVTCWGNWLLQRSCSGGTGYREGLSACALALSAHSRAKEITRIPQVA